MSKPFSGKDWIYVCPNCNNRKSNVIRYGGYELRKCCKCKYEYIIELKGIEHE